MESAYQTSKLEKLLHRTIAGLFALSAVCFMIYTTELHYAHAEGEEDLGSASSPINASVTVGTACNFSGNVDIPHTSTIMNGVNSTDIGKTTMNVTCNDQGGYAVYAIGYTNDEYGNNTLRSSVSDDYNISTGTSTSGNTSNWSMKLATVSGTTTATIENGYSNYNTVPDDYTKVATLNTITNPGTSTAGSSISTTYQTYISPTQPAGTYTGKVKYTLVHPSTDPAPEKPKTIDDLTYTQEFATLSTDDKASVLNSMAEEQQYQLKDSRDQKDYYISKLKDGNIWMTQNLDLDIEAGRTYTSADTDLANSSIGTTWTPTSSTYPTDTTTWNWSYTTPESYDPGDLCWDGTPDSNIAESCNQNNSHYHLGNYYNWTAAIAMSNSSSYTTQKTDVNQSICPAGWMLPKSGDQTGSGSFTYLKLQYKTITAWNEPLYFPLSGDWGGTLYSLSTNSRYWSSVVYNNNHAYRLFTDLNGNFFGDYGGRGEGYTIRCVAR